jgi:hypothetical protein
VGRITRDEHDHVPVRQAQAHHGHASEIGEVDYFHEVAEILENVSTVGMKFEKAKKIVDQVGVVPFRMMMKEYFGTLADLSSDHKMIQEFIDYADDLEIDVISLIAKGNREFIRFNIGYGGGNGGYLVIQKNGDTYQKISKTEDGDLVYCDASVWN